MKVPWIGKALRGTRKRFYKKQTSRQSRRCWKQSGENFQKRPVSRGWID